MSTWKHVGMTYLKYADLCATHLRNALKEPMKTKAKDASSMHARVTKWEGGKRGNPGAPLAARHNIFPTASPPFLPLVACCRCALVLRKSRCACVWVGVRTRGYSLAWIVGASLSTFPSPCSPTPHAPNNPPYIHAMPQHAASCPSYPPLLSLRPLLRPNLGALPPPFKRSAISSSRSSNIC